MTALLSGIQATQDSIYELKNYYMSEKFKEYSKQSIEHAIKDMQQAVESIRRQLGASDEIDKAEEQMMKYLQEAAHDRT